MSRLLADCDAENTPRWNFNGLKVVGKVTSIYDGDTMTVAFETRGLGYYQHVIRLMAIDAPEMRSKLPDEKKAAIAARDHLRGLALGKEVDLVISETDKWGRLVATVGIGGLDLSAEMLASGHAQLYTGGTREPFILPA